MAAKASSRFSIRPALLGEGYVIVYLPERSPQMEVRQTFASEDEARSGFLQKDRDGSSGFQGRDDYGVIPQIAALALHPESAWSLTGGYPKTSSSVFKGNERNCIARNRTIGGRPRCNEFLQQALAAMRSGQARPKSKWWRRYRRRLRTRL
jgi:hypothetical protein